MASVYTIQFKPGWCDTLSQRASICCLGKKRAGTSIIQSSVRVDKAVPIKTKLQLVRRRSGAAYGSCFFLKTAIADIVESMRLQVSRGSWPKPVFSDALREWRVNERVTADAFGNSGAKRKYQPTAGRIISGSNWRHLNEPATEDARRNG
jgi:hypothetical protein